MNASTTDNNSRKNMLDDGDLLDFVDFIVTDLDISLKHLRAMNTVPEFNAAACAYRSSLACLTLGYSAFFCWPKAYASFKQITEEQSLDYVRVASYCGALATDDKRQIELDDDVAREHFPVLFQAEQLPFVGSERSNHLSSLSLETQSFAVKHSFRSSHFSSVRASDEDDYIAYWVSNSEPQISRYLDDRRFMAGLDAFSQDVLSFHGFLQKVFGLDYYNNLLRGNGYAIFQGLRRDLSGRVLVKLAREVQSGQRPIAADLRSEFPDMYEPYQPELYGT